MKLPCIAIDVSKGKSHVRSFFKLGKEYGKTFSFEHNKEGFEVLMDRYNELKENSGHDVMFIFESTGVYHKVIQHFLEQKNKKFIMISPLQSAKVRKLDLRAAKTDKLDPMYIAKAYYMLDIDMNVKKQEVYDELMQLDRYYEVQLTSLTKAKVHYRESLDLVFPKLDEHFDVYDPCVVLIIQKYKHPENIQRREVKTVIDYLTKKNSHRKAYLQSFAITFIDYCKDCMSGCGKSDVAIDILLGHLDSIEHFQQKVDYTFKRMRELARSLKQYEQFISIPGVGEILATRLIAEIGDMDRFDSHKQLIAYAGIEPTIYQSGKRDGMHYRMSKKGNKVLRKLLYLAIACNLRSKTQDNKIKEFYQKKRQQDNPMYYLAAYFACANKLLRIIYGMYKSNSIYQ
ncbi:IS110 family transposase [Breznakia sp. OttesenSCG-928-G09]|nr:IS110 family transposase [Breznakia sp. OttesenSCG-928-G09]